MKKFNKTKVLKKAISVHQQKPVRVKGMEKLISEEKQKLLEEVVNGLDIVNELDEEK